MRDEHPIDRLGAYADAALGNEAKVAIESHLDQCPACREVLRALRAQDAALAAAPVPDPGPAYWSQFTARVEAKSRREPASDPVRRYERLSAWLFSDGRFAWPRAVGALVACTLAVYIGLHGVRPQEVIDRAPSTHQAPELGIPPASDAVNLPPGPASESNAPRAKSVPGPTPNGAPGAAISQPLAARAGAAKPAPAVEGSPLAKQQETATPALPPVAAVPRDNEVSVNAAQDRIQPSTPQELIQHDVRELGGVSKPTRGALSFLATRIDTLAAVDSLLQQEAVLWSHRDELARRAELARVAEALARHPHDARALTRARPLLDWLAETSRDNVERQRWLALRGSLPQ